MCVCVGGGGGGGGGLLQCVPVPVVQMQDKGLLTLLQCTVVCNSYPHSLQHCLDTLSTENEITLSNCTSKTADHYRKLKANVFPKIN